MRRVAMPWPSSRRDSPLPGAMRPMRPSGMTPEERRALEDLVACYQRREVARSAFSEAELARLRHLRRRYQSGGPDAPAGGAAA